MLARVNSVKLLGFTIFLLSKYMLQGVTEFWKWVSWKMAPIDFIFYVFIHD